MTQPAKTFNQRLRFWAGVLFSLITLVWVVLELDWREVGHSLVEVHHSWVLLASGFVLLTAVLRTFRWRVLFLRQRIPFRALFSALIIGQAANYVTPARMGDILRIYLVGEAAKVNRAQALGTLAMEKLWDILILIALTSILGWFAPVPDWLLNPAKGLIVLTGIAIFCLVIIFWQQGNVLHWLEQVGLRWWPSSYQRLVTIPQNFLAGFAGARSPQALVSAGFWSLLVWGSGGVTNYFIFRAFEIPSSGWLAFVLLIVLQVGVAVPSLPGRVGIFEAICVFVLVQFDVPENVAFSYGLILHLVAFGPPILVAAIVSWQLGLSPRQVRFIGAESREQNRHERN